MGESTGADTPARALLHIALILALGLVAYSNTLEVPFVFDDVQNITDNPLVRDVSNIPSYFAGGKGPFSSRPLMHATFALNYRFGGFDTTGYHAVNLALHLINCVLLYLLVSMTGRNMGIKEPDVRNVALLASALFAVHPADTEAVTYVVSRSMLFSTTFYMLGMILFLKAVTSERNRNIHIAVLFVVAILGSASRENFVAFPLMLLLYDLFFVSGFRMEKVKEHWKAYVPAAAGILYLAHLATGHTYAQKDAYLGEGVPPLKYALTQLNVHWTYLRMLVFPVGQNIDHDYRIARTLLELPTFASFIGYAGLWALGIWLARKRPVIAFGLLWFLITLTPVSFIVAALKPRLDDVILEHRLYLPSAGIFVAASALAIRARGRLSDAKARTAVTAAFSAVILALTVAAYQRNSVWQSGVSLWEDVVRKSPDKVRGFNNLGNAYGRSGDYDRAIANLEKALSLRPEMPVSRYYYAEMNYNLAVLYGLKGLTDKAEARYKASLELRPTADAFNNLGAIYFERGMTREAIELYVRALEADPLYVNAHFNLGEAYLKLDVPALAIKHYLEFIERRPNNAQAHEDLAQAYAGSGQSRKAAEHLRIAEQLRRKQ